MQKIAWSLLVAAMVSTSAAAQQTGGTESAPQTPAAPVAAPEPASKRVTLTAGLDFTNAYVFRGIYQEDRGVIGQPLVDLGVGVYEGTGALKSVGLNVGTWNSQHSGPTGKWYEADYYGSVTFGFGKVKPSAVYTSYTSPNDRFKSVHELAGVLAIDDSASPFPVSPKVTVAFELSGQADGGAQKGTYLELGIRPGVKVAKALTLAIPVKVGLSLRDYYEGPTGSNRFGYFDTGLIASVPLVSGKTTWEAHGGVDLLWFGENMKLLNSGDGFKPVFSIGLSFGY